MKNLILVLIVAAAGYYWWDRDQKAKAAAEQERIAAVQKAEAEAAAERERKSRELPKWMQAQDDKKPANRNTKKPKEMTNSRDIREQWGWKEGSSLDRKK